MEILINPDRSRWTELCQRPSSDNPVVRERVEAIIERVKTRGDEALKALSLEIDHRPLDAIEVSQEEFDEAEAAVKMEVKHAIARAMANILAFHKAQLPNEVYVETMPGVKCWQRPVPIEKVGLYIPGGTAPLFSTVLMLALPARLAGCKTIVLCTPTGKDGKVAPEVLFSARSCGVEKVFKLGGAQAVAAMAYGTASVSKVDKIFGPGNQYVTTAKQILRGRVVAIAMHAGPSEVMVLADASARPAFVAADLLSQAEHGADSQAMLVCDSVDFAEKVKEEVLSQAARLGRMDYVQASLSKSRLFVLEDENDRVELVNAYGAEHLILSVKDPWRIADRITAAGSVFIGHYSPESAGDYASGTNHTLPTCGWAASYSGVNIDSFMRKMTLQELTPEGLQTLSRTILTMAEAEGLDAHANAVRVRLAEGQAEAGVTKPADEGTQAAEEKEGKR
ncbi:MAG: histidinol dehydrogenase [Bacteroidales bacterium]|nr:histidinol dehydrogenase [Bacteroidales bacterium]